MLYPQDMDSTTLDDLGLRQMFCHFLSASLLTVLARSEDNREAQVKSGRISICKLLAYL